MSLLYLADVADPTLLRAFADSGWVVHAATTDEADWALEGSDFRFVLLDLKALRPDLLKRCLDASGSAVVLVLLGDPDRQARIEALRAGAELCLSRPLAFVELQARLNALSREFSPAVNMGESLLWLSPTRLLLGRGTRHQAVTVSEQRLLAILARNPGAVSRDLIEQHLWGSAQESRSALIERHVCNLRRKLAVLDAPNALQTLRGFGYSLRETVHLRMD
ncbi:response regulator transcription factor [Pseudomonas sp. dw_358]|uniref:response regulator transcription factor n=1 Tax=Pseudomonas sp. dw_358 TaxID=2720083 RepID=UPI001BD272E4|nr:response regulator transcription factor [Pseudomonas sp. dw_358]